ncbi:MAG: hypothetical protein ACI4XJ_07985 [Eubacteriales bacterium]
MIYIADSKWNPTLPNPFTADGSYGENWSAFIYDDSTPYFSNVYPDTKVYVLKFAPAADPENLRFFDFLWYEQSYGRNVIVRFCSGMNANEILSRFHNMNNVVNYRISDGEVLVHSTTLSSWESIKREGALLSPSMLRRKGQAIREIGLNVMLEPKDYSDYVMLDIPNGCGELVVNSRNLGYVCTDPNVPYSPGIRLYFDVKRLFRDGLVTRDGLHPVKIRGKLPLDGYLLAAISSKDFPYEIQWTPTKFTEKANELFFSVYRNKTEFFIKNLT